MSKPNVVFVLGAPGAGKGTQCTKIVEKYGYVHLSAGDLLRAEQSKGDSDVGKEIAEHIKNGTIVPVKVTCGLVKKAMEETMAKFNKHNFLIDGFPRNKDNLDGWNAVMSGDVNLKFVLFFDVSTETGVKRCLERGKSSGRTDDNEESLRKRIVTYTEATMPIIEIFEKENKVRNISAEESADKVFKLVQKEFD